MSTMNLQQRLNDLFSYIRQGKIMEARNEFYDQNTMMQENTNPPTKGPAANIECKKQFMRGVRDFIGFTVTTSGVGDNATFYESTTDIVTTGCVPVHCHGQPYDYGRRRITPSLCYRARSDALRE